MTRLSATTGRSEGYDEVKLEEAIQYICATATAEDRLGAVKLNKILFYADMLQFAERGESITGASYAKRPRGPVPKQVTAATADLERKGRLKVDNISSFDMVRREYTVFDQPDLTVFKVGEVERLNQMVRYVCSYTAKDIGEISHTDVWHAADMGEDLPYPTFLVSEFGIPDESDLEAAVADLSVIERDTHIIYA